MRDIRPLNMYAHDLEFVNNYKYLGVDVVAGDKISFLAI